MFKKILALLLALIMVMAMFVGCGKKETSLDDETSADATVAETTTEAEETEEETKNFDFETDANVEVDATSPLDELTIEELLTPELFQGSDIPEDRDYGGYTFNVLGDTTNYQREFVAESDGDLIKDAVINRQEWIEEYVGIDFQITESEGGYYNMEGFAADIEAASGAGTPYDLAIAYNLIPPVVAAKGLSKDLAESKNLNLLATEKEYWGKEIKQEIMVGGRIFWMSDNSSWNNIRSMLCMYVNLEYFSRINEGQDKEDLYDMVLNGAWTFENMLVLIDRAYENTNVEEEGIDDLDSFGLCAAQTNPWLDNWLYAAGYRYTKLNSRGTYDWTLGDQPIVDFINWWQEELLDEDIDRTSGTGAGMFTDGRCMFILSYVGLVESGLELDCTVLPMPLYNSSVKNTYSTPFSNGYSSWLIPKAAKSEAFERSATVLELLAAEGNRRLAPVYFEIYLKRQFAANDENMRKMFNVIRNSIVFDMGYLYGSSLTCENLAAGSGYAEVFIFLRRVWTGEQAAYSNITSVWAAIKNTATTKLNNLMVDILDY